MALESFRTASSTRMTRSTSSRAAARRASGFEFVARRVGCSQVMKSLGHARSPVHRSTGPPVHRPTGPPVHPSTQPPVMSDLVLRPRSATELIDAAFQVYRRAPVPFMVAMALIYVPWLAIRLIFSLNIPETPDQITGNVCASAVHRPGPPALSSTDLAGGAVSVLARAAYLEEPIDVAAAFRQTLGRMLAARHLDNRRIRAGVYRFRLLDRSRDFPLYVFLRRETGRRAGGQGRMGRSWAIGPPVERQ